MGRLPSLEWEQMLGPPRPNSRRWTRAFVQGRDFSANPKRPLEPHGFAQMVRKWAVKLDLKASVRVRGQVVTATLTRRPRDRGADSGPPDPRPAKKAG